MPIQSAAVIGLGSLGICQAAVLAHAGVNVYGIDIDEQRVEDVNRSIAPSPEPKLEEYLTSGRSNITATTDYSEAVPECDVSIIFVDSPLTDSGEHSTEYIEAACKTLGKELAEIDEHHTVILRSTVSPGTLRKDIKRWLDEASGKRVGEEVSLAYVPEFTAVGNVIPGMENPDFFIVGEINPEGGEVATELCHTMRQNTASVLRMDAESAELAKMANNTFRTMKISFANSLAQVADKVGANVDEVANHFQEDSHVNAKYMHPGVKYGGPCYARDNIAFDAMAESTPSGSILPVATDEVNKKHSRWIAETVRNFANTSDDRILVQGLSYKPGTGIVTASQGCDLVRNLADEFEILCHDPAAIPNARESLEESVEFVSELDTALGRADVTVITTLWDEYLSPEVYLNRDLTIIDPWRTLSTEDFGRQVEYIPLGKRSVLNKPSE